VRFAKQALIQLICKLVPPNFNDEVQGYLHLQEAA